MAPLTGPFPHAAFLEAWESEFAPPSAETFVAHSRSGGLPIWIDDGVVRFQGGASVTDYHSPLGSSIEPSVKVVAERFTGSDFSFDSLPSDGLGPLSRALDRVAADLTIRQHSSALVLDLPNETGLWLASLSKKHRHEVRRKRRRFADRVGEPVLERRTDPEAFATFLALHRVAAGDKATFMTNRAERFFAALLATAGASIEVLSVDSRPVAAVFGFADRGGYYVYNAAYDPDVGDAAPGIVLMATLIERSISDGLPRFDFLKGDERYKYHLGAVERPLAAIEGTFK